MLFKINNEDLLMIVGNQWNLYVGRITPRGKVIWSQGIKDLPDYQVIRQSAEEFVNSLK